MNFFLKKLASSLIKKASDFISYTIPRNYEYRPTGVYLTSKDYISAFKDEGLQYKTVYKGNRSFIEVNDQLYSDLLAVEKNAHKYVKEGVELEDVFIVEVKNARIYSDHLHSTTIFASDNKLIQDISLNLKSRKNQMLILQRKYFHKPVKFEGTVFNVLTGGGGINNYFHWLVDVLTRIHLLKERGLYNEVDWFLMPSFKHRYQKETVKLLGIPEEKIIRGDLHPHITADKVIASSNPRMYGHVPAWIHKFLKDSFLKHKDNKGKYSPLIYISRGDSQVRNIANEPELIDMLKKYGFEVYQLRDLNFTEQVALFANADCIVAPHGAGLVNLVFCKPGTKVIELFTEAWLVALGLYPDMCAKSKLVYDYMICKPVGLTFSKKHRQQTSYYVEPDLLNHMLVKHLKNDISAA